MADPHDLGGVDDPSSDGSRHDIEPVEDPDAPAPLEEDTVDRGPIAGDDEEPFSGDLTGLSGEEDLQTGAWHSLGATAELGRQVAVATTATSGVRLRRVGERVEIEKIDPGSSVEVDGIESGPTSTVSLAAQVVKIDGVRVTDDMVPLDTLDLAELPDFFAPILIGRAPDCDYVLTDDSISARHAGLSRQEGYLLLEDLDSANGTYVEDRRVKRVRISWRTVFEVGSHKLTAVEVVKTVRMHRMAQSTSVLQALPSGELVEQPRTTSIGPESKGDALVADGGKLDFPTGTSRIVGRDPTADIVLDTPNVSRLHARLERTSEGLVVEDLGSTNGTWVNGGRIKGRVVVEPGDDLRFGPQRIELEPDFTVQTRTVASGVTGVRLDASRLIREVGPKRRPKKVVDGVSFSILPGEMVAIMGPSGAGKTSVLTTLAGYTPPSGGHVYMDGMSLYDHYDVFRSAIGYVPQEDVMHRPLTAREVLYYQAKLNFPSEVKDPEIRTRIETVLQQLDLESVGDTVVGDEVRRGMSGGQRKRLNVAMELLSEPSVLLLDEPTSGLDARSAMQLIKQCRDLASAGRTVIMTIHQPRLEAFDLFDKLLLLTKGGKLAYFGPSKGAKEYFTERSALPADAAENPADYVLDVLDPLEEKHARQPAHWRKQFRGSDLYERFVKSRLRKEDREAERKAAGRTRSRKANPIRQLITLTRRYALLKWRDRNALLVQLMQAPIIAGLAVLLFHQGRFSPLYLEDDITPTLFVLVASAVWFGCSNVAREVVGESAIFRRERYRTLRPGPYLLSKMLGQGLLIALQIGILLAILVPAVPLEGPLLPLIGMALLAGWSAMALGLLVSTIARTELQAIQFVPLVILPQIMLSGILLPVAGEKASLVATWLAKPCLLRWAYSASLHTELTEGTLRGDKSRGIAGAKYWERSGFIEDALQTDLLVMGGLGLACAIACWLLLLGRDRR